MTKEEFVQKWLRHSHLKPDHLSEFGLVPHICHCDEGGCQGWQMVREHLWDKWDWELHREREPECYCHKQETP